MINKYDITINGEKVSIEGCNHISAIGRAYRDFINGNGTKDTDKVTLEIVSEKVGGVEAVKMEGEEVKEETKEEEKVDLKKAQEAIDASRVVISEGKK